MYFLRNGICSSEWHPAGVCSNLLAGCWLFCKSRALMLVWWRLRLVTTVLLLPSHSPAALRVILAWMEQWSLGVMLLSRLYPHGIESIFEKGQEAGFACTAVLYANGTDNWLHLFADSLKLNAPSHILCLELQSGDRHIWEKKIIAFFLYDILGVQGRG